MEAASGRAGGLSLRRGGRHHLAFDDGQQLGERARAHPEGATHRQGGAEVVAGHVPLGVAHLPGEPGGQPPDRLALYALGAVFPRRALGASSDAASAVPVAPAVVPSSEGAEPFPSVRSSSPLLT